MPLMNGLELRAFINQSDYLRKKAIPFVFPTTTATREAIRQAYDESVQGFYEKVTSIATLRHQLKLIIEYWQNSLHPNGLS